MKKLLSLSILVGSLALFGAGCLSPSPTTSSPSGATNTNAKTRVVTISNFAFAPDTVTVNAGDTVIWKNQDSVTHTVTSDGAIWDSGAIAPGASYSRVMQSPGNYPFHCSIHTTMHGTIVVK